MTLTFELGGRSLQHKRESQSLSPKSKQSPTCRNACLSSLPRVILCLVWLCGVAIECGKKLSKLWRWNIWCQECVHVCRQNRGRERGALSKYPTCGWKLWLQTLVAAFPDQITDRSCFILKDRHTQVSKRRDVDDLRSGRRKGKLLCVCVWMSVHLLFECGTT